MASIQIQNAASSAVVSAAVASTAAVAINHPVGLLGGAMYGAVYDLTKTVAVKLLGAMLDNPDPIIKTASFAISFFASSGAAWYALALAGFTLTFTEVVILTGVSMLIKAAFTAISTNFFNIDAQQAVRRSAF